MGKNQVKTAKIVNHKIGLFSNFLHNKNDGVPIGTTYFIEEL